MRHRRACSCREYGRQKPVCLLAILGQTGLRRNTQQVGGMQAVGIGHGIVVSRPGYDRKFRRVSPSHAQKPRVGLAVVPIQMRTPTPCEREVVLISS